MGIQIPIGRGNFDGEEGVDHCKVLNHPSAAAMRLMSNYFDHLLSLATPT